MVMAPEHGEPEPVTLRESVGHTAINIVEGIVSILFKHLEDRFQDSQTKETATDQEGGILADRPLQQQFVGKDTHSD